MDLTVLDGNFRLCHGSHPDKGADLDHIWKKRMRSAAKYLYTFDVEEVGAHSSNLCAHAVEHVAELLQIRFAGSIVNGGLAFGHHCGHDDVGCTRYGCLIEEHVGSF